MTETPYRCVECGDGSNLTACAYGVCFGPLAANGRELATHDDVDETDLAEDSIQCNLHPDAALEKRIDGLWHRWETCAPCDGLGREDPAYYANRQCRECVGKGGAWVAVTAVAA